MHIERIETFTAGDIGVVRAETGEGITGIGQFPPRDPGILASICHEHVAPQVIGRDIADRTAINRDVVTRHRDTVGLVSRALAGVDTAMWDIIGKAQDRPVWDIAGGSSGSIPAYASSMRRDTEPDEEANRLRELCDTHGFEAVKLRIGKVGAPASDEDEWPGRTEELLPTAREVLGDDIEIYVDANTAFTPERALEIANGVLAPNDVAMFEEPVPYWDIDATATVTEGTDVPIGAGEFLNRPHDWDRMIDGRAVDIVQPDICFSVGFTRALDIARRAAEAGIETRPHSSLHSMNLVFAAHLVSAVDSPEANLEYPIDHEWVTERWNREPGWDTHFYEPNLTVSEGMVSIPDGPGWGLTVDADWLGSAERRVSTAS